MSGAAPANTQVVATEPPSAVRATGLTKRYGAVLALDRLDLDIPAGSIFGLLGPNGAGKTTTIRILTGLAAATPARRALPALPQGSIDPSCVRGSDISIRIRGSIRGCAAASSSSSPGGSAGSRARRSTRGSRTCSMRPASAPRQSDELQGGPAGCASGSASRRP